MLNQAGDGVGVWILDLFWISDLGSSGLSYLDRRGLNFGCALRNDRTALLRRIQHPRSPFEVEFILPTSDDGRGNAVANQVRYGARFGHEAIDAEHEDHAFDRNRMHR